MLPHTCVMQGPGMFVAVSPPLLSFWSVFFFRLQETPSRTHTHIYIFPFPLPVCHYLLPSQEAWENMKVYDQMKVVERCQELLALLGEFSFAFHECVRGSFQGVLPIS